MKNAQLYCTLSELIQDLSLNGNQPMLFSRIQAASRFIEKRFGNFIPMLETRSFHGNGISLRVDRPLLSISEAKNNDQVITDYDLHPSNRHWDNGPYTRIEIGSGSWDEAEITGEWGKYSELEQIEGTVTQLIAAKSLTATNGSLLSPGMVLQIEAEQELIIDWGSPTLAVSQLNGAVDAAQEELIVDNGAEFNEREVIQLSTEDCYIRMIRGNTLVVARGWNNTTKQSHLENAAISVYRSFAVERAVNGTVAAAHADAAISRYLVPADVNWLCRQIAGLMHKKAQSGFAGKVGNAELGETFYFNEFPGQVKEIGRNYRLVSL